MKISIAISILILLVAALIGIPKQQRLTQVRASHAKLIATAGQLGISVDFSDPDAPVRTIKRNRDHKAADAKLMAAELIAYAKEMEAMEQAGNTPTEVQQKRIMEFMDRMMSLDSSQLKTLIIEISNAKGVSDEIRTNLLGFSVMTLANDHPQLALTLFTESADLLEESGLNNYLISSSLAKWANDDPLGAVEWVKKNNLKFPDLITDDAKRSLISGAATQDPKLAFKLIGELGIKEVSHAIVSIVSSAKTPEEQTNTLSALREHLATLNDEKTKKDLSAAAMQNLAHEVKNAGFEAGTRWVDDSKLTPAELEGFVRGLNGRLKSEEQGQWIEWIGEKLPAKESARNIKSLVSEWTRTDYQAAGKWLSATADGLTKHTAIRSYAETIASYEPATAAQWAMTLPPGKQRDETLGNIYENWPPNDTAAKEAFKQEHGIK